MSNIQNAENKLNDALSQLRGEAKERQDIKEPEIEIIPNEKSDIEIEVETPKRRTEFVPVDDPKIQERINDLYRQVKGSDQRNQMLFEHNKMMEEKLLEYQNKLTEFEKNSKAVASSQIENELKAKLRQAREEHDLDTIEKVEDKLLDLRMEQRLPQIQPIQTKQPSPAQQHIDKDFLRNAAYLEVISQEKDVNGNPVRDYLYDTHPDNWKAVQLYQTVPQELAAAGKHADIKSVMDVIHERIKGKPKTSAKVLGGDAEDVPERKTVRLTQDELYVAKRMGLKPEAYARQKQLINR